MSISKDLNIIANSFTNAILTSLWTFSITLAASAIFIDDTGRTSASITDSYSFLIFLREYLFDADTILGIVLRVLTWSPTLILSGLYPT